MRGRQWTKRCGHKRHPKLLGVVYTTWHLPLHGMLWRTDHDYGTIVPRLQADVALPAGRCNEHQAP